MDKKQHITKKQLNINRNQSLDYNRNNNNNSKNNKKAFNLKYQIETRKLLRDANEKVNNINRKPVTHDNNHTLLFKGNVAVIEDSMIKYILRKDLSSQEKDNKNVTCPGVRPIPSWIIENNN